MAKKKGGGAPKPNFAAELVDEVEAQLDLFTTAESDTYADIETHHGHRITMRIRGRAFRQWLRGAFRRMWPGEVASNETLAVVVDELDASAATSGVVREIAVRIGRHGGKVYLDLGRPDWRIVEVDAEGWRECDDCPVRFVRQPGMLPLPLPERSLPAPLIRDPGDDTPKSPLLYLRPFFNLARPADFNLLMTFLVASLVLPDHHVLLAFFGEPGAAKSTAARVLRRVFDPNSVELRSQPRDEEALFISATKSAVLAFDNLPPISAEMSDALCRLTDGSGLGKRMLYSDADEVLIAASRPVILTGVATIVTKSDLADRTIAVEIGKMPEHQRRSEHDVWLEFSEHHALVLGGLLDAVAAALRNRQSARESLRGKLPRRADFLEVGLAAEETWTTAGSVLNAFEANAADNARAVVEGDVVAKAIFKLMEDREEWTDTPEKLWLDLRAIAGDDTKAPGWPKAINALSGRLRMLAPTLRRLGLDIDRDRSKVKRLITIRRRRGEGPVAEGRRRC